MTPAKTPTQAEALECLSDLIKLANKDQKTAADYDLIRDRSDTIRAALTPALPDIEKDPLGHHLESLRLLGYPVTMFAEFPKKEPAPQDLEALKREALTEFMKGRSSKQLEEIAFDIISETFNWLRMEDHLAAPPVTAPIEKVDGWLPIETAPKGELVLLYCPHLCESNPERIELGYADNGNGSASRMGDPMATATRHPLAYSFNGRGIRGCVKLYRLNFVKVNISA